MKRRTSKNSVRAERYIKRKASNCTKREGEPVSHRRLHQHVRRVSPLPPSRTNEVAGAGNLEDGVEEQVLGPASDEARPELAEDGGVEASVAVVLRSFLWRRSAFCGRPICPATTRKCASSPA